MARLDGDYVVQPETSSVGAVEDEGGERDLDEARQLARPVGVERDRPAGPEVAGLDGEVAVGERGEGVERRRPAPAVPVQPAGGRRRRGAGAAEGAHGLGGAGSRSRSARTTTERRDEFEPFTSTWSPSWRRAGRARAQSALVSNQWSGS